MHEIAYLMPKLGLFSQTTARIFAELLLHQPGHTQIPYDSRSLLNKCTLSRDRTECKETADRGSRCNTTHTLKPPILAQRACRAVQLAGPWLALKRGSKLEIKPAP